MLIWSQSFTVSGTVNDEANNPVAYSNILLLKSQDSTIVTGTTSDDNGKFIFNNVASGSFILKTSFVSYSDNFRNIVVDSNRESINIVLKESIEALSEVELVYRKPTIDRKSDRLVFNVEKSALSEGNLLEVLRNTPRVLVLDDAITVKGSEPTIYINDRKVHISSREVTELLQGTSASNIKSVEVITNPSARYDAESGVVLNIVMTKNLVSGYNGSVFTNAEQGVFLKTNHGMTNYFKGNKVSLFANYSYNNRKVDRVDIESIKYTSENWLNDFDRNTWTETHNFNMNFDWDLNENTTLSLGATTQFLPYFKRHTRSITDITPKSITETGMFRSFNLSKDEKHNLGFDFDFVHLFNENAKLAFNSHYTTYDYRRHQDVKTNYFYGDNSFETSTAFNTVTDQDAEIITSQIDYSTAISESSNFEMGIKYSNVKSESDILQNDIIGGVEVLNLANTDTFNYTQDVYSAYTSYNSNWDKWSLSAGLRVEQTNIEGVSISTSQINKQDYLEWFPSINIGLQTSEKVNVFVNYKRSLQRPDFSYLNPFKYFLSDKVFVTGNPDLKPIFIDHFSVGTSINNTFTIEAYYKKNNNNIFELPFQDNVENTFIYTSVNIDYTEEIGLDVEAYFDILENWNVYIGSSFYNYADTASLFGDTIKRNKWSNYTVLSNDWSFLKDNSLSANLTLIYKHESVQGLQTIDTKLDSYLSITKRIFKGKGNLSLILSDLFNEQDFFITTNFANQNNTSFINLDNRYIKLGFNYKFGNSKLSTNERTSSVEERDRLGTKH